MNTHILAFVDLRPNTPPPPPDEPEPDDPGECGIDCELPDVGNESSIVSEEPSPNDPPRGAE